MTKAKLKTKEPRLNKQTSETIHSDIQLYGLRARMTNEQVEYSNAIYTPKKKVVWCNAGAGTGKTTVAVAVAKLLKEEGYYDGLIYVFNPTEEDKMGFRPGTQTTKEREYLTPLKDALIEIGEEPSKVIKIELEEEDQPKYVNLKGVEINHSNAWITAVSHTFFRGSNKKRQIVIIDEAQNFTKAQLKKILTRCHDNCKVIVIGHVGQIDLKNPKHSGFVHYINHFLGEEQSQLCVLTKNFRGWLAQHADSIDEAS